MRRLVFAFALLTSGCDLYFTDNDKECKAIPAAELVPENYLRDPSTGECTGFGGGCDDPCSPSICAPGTADIAPPDWGSCVSACDGLGAAACMDAPGCYAAFWDFPTAAFRGCFQTAPSGPVGGTCSNLDAYQCSRHDDCVAYYDGTGLARTSPRKETFVACGPEPTGASCETADCAPGTHCVDTCDQSGQCHPVCEPDVDVCAGIDCGPGWACTQVCSGPSCGAQCVPSGSCEMIGTENACKTRPDCTAVYLGDDCTCTPAGGCTCEILTYDRCETK